MYFQNKDPFQFYKPAGWIYEPAGWIYEPAGWIYELHSARMAHNVDEGGRAQSYGGDPPGTIPGGGGDINIEFAPRHPLPDPPQIQNREEDRKEG